MTLDLKGLLQFGSKLASVEKVECERRPEQFHGISNGRSVGNSHRVVCEIADGRHVGVAAMFQA
ncbi:hypothetical protein [Bosea sp. TAF32]|uniref:hypothetical protein n=1 Tax=Bosea sp. TAF32 TaxID=3237482 RepID=UPI003F8FE993